METKEEKKKVPFWKLRGANADLTEFQTPSKLWSAACKYFKFVDENPLFESKLVKYKDVSTVENTPLMRPYTLSGLCFFLGCSEAAFRKFKKNIAKQASTQATNDINTSFISCIHGIEQVIETQQLEGAMIGIFNYNIVRAKLGLVDKQDVTSNGETIMKINVQKAKDLKNIEALF